MTAEQLKELVLGITKDIAGAGVRPRDDHQGKLQIKDFERLDKYSGGEELWQEWADDFEVAVKAKIPRVEQVMKVAVKRMKASGSGTAETIEEMEIEKLADIDDLRHVDLTGMDKASGELYQVLMMMTSGEAKTVVKQSREKDGFKAWAELAARFDRRSMGRAFRELRECMYPTPVKALSEVNAAIGIWEDRWKRMEANTGGSGIPEVWKMAAMLEVCPKEVKEMMLVRLDELKDFKALKEKVIVWVTNKLEQGGGPVPMDIGEVDDNYDNHDYNDDYTVDAVSNGKCFNCGGYGHYARDCQH